jgi:hypothetical protein
VSVCRYCHTDIAWRRTRPGGKPMPVDLDVWFLMPGEGTDVGVTDSGEVVRGARLDQPRQGAHRVRTPHFATCKAYPGRT